MVDLIWECRVSPNFQRPLAAKLYTSNLQTFRNAKRAWGLLSPCQVWWASDLTRRQDGQNIELFVCLFVRHVCDVTLGFWTTEFVHNLAMKPLEYRKYFHTVDRESLRLCPMFNFLGTPPIWRHHKMPMSKTAKFVGFKDDRINWSRRNRACERRP